MMDTPIRERIARLLYEAENPTVPPDISVYHLRLADAVLAVTDPTKLAIGQEIYKAMQRLGAQSPLLATVGSYGDTLPDEEILRQLRAHNAHAEGK